MTPNDFLHHLAEQAISDAIAQAEARTSGEIRVYVSTHQVPDPLPEAEKHFLRLGMDRTRDRNGVLLFIAPRSQRFAIVGDQAIHQRCPPTFWTDIAAEMSACFQQSAFTEGLVRAIGRAGNLLAEHFPRQADDRNELSDKVATDDPPPNPAG